ncbi:WD repeat-containing protein on Y chromosome-like [Odontesthes bonariensis]|uniref:WD repeat-containing protein on Y chromosome-like n=1 Tax=Odontesthes bonariensis TaxID=219752 RepID=UPI003F587156
MKNDDPSGKAGSELEESEKMFTADDIPAILEVFGKYDADGSGGLDIDEFSMAMQELYSKVDEEELRVLHMKIDTNCDKTVDIGELLNFLMHKTSNAEALDYKNQLFPKPFELITFDTHRLVVKIICLPFKHISNPKDGAEDASQQLRPYQKCLYLSISTDGVLKYWPDDFKMSCTFPLYERDKETPPLHHKRKMHVNDVVYIKEIEKLAVATSDRELLFYECNKIPELLRISFCLIVDEDKRIQTINYSHSEKKGMFSFGDSEGFLSVFISYDVCENGLFCKNMFEKKTLGHYPVAYTSSLLKTVSKDFVSFRIPIFPETFRNLQYFPCMESFIMCGESSKSMAVVTLSTCPESVRPKISKKVFECRDHDKFFTCAEYSPWSHFIMTGGKDGLLRVWFPHKTSSCEEILKGHKTAITNIVYNPTENVFVSLSTDKNVRIWSDGDWTCRQRIFIVGMKEAPISTVYYNIYNNELFLANSDIAKCLGRGTNDFHNSLTSHNMPVCSVLYHNIYKQIVSVCMSGIVTVWDVLTGKAAMQFRVTPEKSVGHTAIAFDQAQRQVITISPDGKVKLWNFSNGQELKVLPVEMPKDVTQIICKDSKIFVSAKKCKTIFRLDIEGGENIFLEHHLLNDICSMELHKEILITASNEGNVVMWDTLSLDAVYYLKTRESLRTHLTFRDTGHSGVIPTKKKVKRLDQSNPTEEENDENVRPFVVSLKTREVDIGTATLLISAGGYIGAWSVKAKGGQIGKFKAVVSNAVITYMITDESEKTLVTGDSTGRICLWDIQNFGYKTEADTGPWRVSLQSPPLLASWQACRSELVCVACDNACANIVTTGQKNIKQWTNTGQFVGLFGKDQWGSNTTQGQIRENIDKEQEEQVNAPKEETFPKTSTDCDTDIRELTIPGIIDKVSPSQPLPATRFD